MPCPSWAWSGKVIGVADGDTITVLSDKRPLKIRLYGIDCPEKRQPFGKRAKQFTSDLVFGKVVDIEPIAIDRYGRTVAFVRVGNLSVNEELIKEGLAWVYLSYCKLPSCIE
jgi:micrococcal nuclease